MKTVPLGEVVKIVSGATPKTGIADYWNGAVPWVTPADLSKLKGAYISETPRTLTDAGVRSCATTILPAGSVLLSSRAPIGHVAVNTVPMATNQGFKSLVPGVALHTKFLYYWVKANKDYLQSLGNGATFKELSKRTVEQIQVPLPAVDEQRRIAAILDHADARRTKRRRVLAHLDALAQSIFHEMFGHCEADTELGSVCTRVTDGTHQSPVWTSSGVPFLFVSNITSGEIKMDTRKFISHDTWRELTRRTPIDVGDILYSTVGSYGLPVVVRTSERFAFQRHIAHLKPDAEVLLPDFLSAQLASPALKRQAQRAARGIAQPTVNLADIKKFRIVLPAVSRQRDFAERLVHIDLRRDDMRRSTILFDELFAALQARAFKGEL